VPTQLVLVRHGETDWNRENRFQGHADPPLNDTGRQQAAELAAQLESETFAAAYTSPLRRAHETATVIADALGIDLIADDRLTEVDVGSWSGLTRAEAEQRFPEGFARWLEYGHGWDDGETYDDLGARVVEALTTIARLRPGATVLVVTHGGPIRSALAAASDVPLGEARRSIHVIGNCAVVRLTARDDRLAAQVDTP
jgi:broad specificity phosphatase PhoE